MLYLALGVLFIALLWWLKRRFGFSNKAIFFTAVIIVAVTWLTLTGRMNWLYTLIVTVAVALVRILRSPFSYLVMGGLRRLFSRYRSGPAVFRGAWVMIRIDPFSGLVDGEVLEGEFKGKKLSELNEEQINQLLESCGRHDSRSAHIVRLYLNYRRRFGFGAGGRGEQSTHQFDDETEAPNLAQACEILGVSEQDEWPLVNSARQRLLRLSHPDKGGSKWLAQRVNAAWEVVKQSHPNRPR